MPCQVAFLRGINVGGHRVKMERLRDLFEQLQLSDVSTFIASGNVVFEAASDEVAALGRRIERHLEEELGYEVATFIRSLSHVQAIIDFQPFEAVSADHALYIMFLSEPPAEATRRAVLDLRGESDELRFHDLEMYWRCRGRITESPVFDGLGKATRGLATTMRKVTTLQRLVTKFGAP